MKKRAISYPRVSTEEQAIHGYSMEAQEEKNLEHIQRNGWDYIDTYDDPGKSGKNLNRPGIQRVIADLKEDKFDVIVVHKLDRLTRNIGDLHMLLKLFEKHNIEFVSVTENLDTSTAMGKMFVYMLGIFAQWYRENLGEEVIKGQARKHSEGERVSLGLIYGYDTVEGKLVINEEEADLVRRIFGMYVYQGYGYGRICQTLNDDGHKPLVSEFWSPSTVKGMLKNVTYIGMNSWLPDKAPESERKIVQGEHRPIVSKELFELAQTRLERRGNLQQSRSSYNYPFSSIIKCGECGGSYTAHNSVKRRNDRQAYINYRCSNKKKGACTASDIAQLKFQDAFFDVLRAYNVHSDKYTPEPTKGAKQDTEKARKRIERDIAKLETRKSNLGMDLADRIISREDYRSLTETINVQLQSLRNELGLATPEEKKKTRSSDEIAEFVQNLEKDWPYMEDEDRKFIVQMMFERIVIKKEAEVWSITDLEFA